MVETSRRWLAAPIALQVAYVLAALGLLAASLVQNARGVRWVERAAFAESSFAASSFAGATSSAVFPVPNATNAASQYDSFFPDATAVGFAGPTPSAFTRIFRDISFFTLPVYSWRRS